MAKDNGTIEKAEPKKRGPKAKWTAVKVDTMCKAIAAGKSYREAYTAAKVAKATFYDHLKGDSDFSDKVKKAEADYQEWYDSQLVIDCKRSLLELIRGYEYDEKTTEKGIDARTGKVVEKTKIVHKRILPNPTAIIFALCNRDPENWKNRVENTLAGKVDIDNKPSISLSNVPDDLLAQVIEHINAK